MDNPSLWNMLVFYVFASLINITLRDRCLSHLAWLLVCWLLCWCLFQHYPPFTIPAPCPGALETAGLAVLQAHAGRSRLSEDEGALLGHLSHVPSSFFSLQLYLSVDLPSIPGRPPSLASLLTWPFVPSTTPSLLHFCCILGRLSSAPQRSPHLCQ